MYVQSKTTHRGCCDINDIHLATRRDQSMLLLSVDMTDLQFEIPPV